MINANYTAFINDYISKNSQAILSRFSGSVAKSNFASKFAEIMSKYECSFKGMTRTYLGHGFKNYLHNNRHFNVPMQATVYIIRHISCYFMWIN